MVKYAERAPGVYRAKFVALDTAYKITTREGDEMTMWRWLFQETADPTTVGELDTLTSPHFKARSNGLKLFTGMLGRAPTEQDDTDALIGQEFDVVFGPNQAGGTPSPGRPSPRERPYAAGRRSVNGDRRGAAVLGDFTRSVLSERARSGSSFPPGELAALPLTEEEAWTSRRHCRSCGAYIGGNEHPVQSTARNHRYRDRSVIPSGPDAYTGTARRESAQGTEGLP